MGRFFDGQQRLSAVVMANISDKNAGRSGLPRVYRPRWGWRFYSLQDVIDGQKPRTIGDVPIYRARG